MKIIMIACTKRAYENMLRAAAGLSAAGMAAETYVKCDGLPEQSLKEPLSFYTEDWFHRADAFVFFAAAGIAVRLIAPYVRDKFSDPAVIAVDETGHYVIPVLSGHAGGANALAERLSRILGAEAVITTATDREGLFSVDAFAAEQGLTLEAGSSREQGFAQEGGSFPEALPLSENSVPVVISAAREAAKKISARLLAGEPCRIYAEAAEVSSALLSPGWEEIKSLCAGLRKKALSFDGTAPAERAEDADVIISPFFYPGALCLVPGCLTLGIGCRKGTSAGAIEEAVQKAFESFGREVSANAVTGVASIDLKADEAGLLEFCAAHRLTLTTYSAEELMAAEGIFSGSDYVLKKTGADNVCERSAVLLAGGGRLVLPKTAGRGVTVAAAVITKGSMQKAGGHTEGSDSQPGSERVPDAEEATCKNVLYAVGIGPGGRDGMTKEAEKVLSDCQVIAGYGLYADLIREQFPGKEWIVTGMRAETERCRNALEAAHSGKRTAVVCSGDAGVYGMAGLLLQMAAAWPDVEIRVVPGVTAALGGAAVLGSPLGHDFCVISLSDLMTPWEVIERRLLSAAEADFCICLYNPASRGRKDHLRRACSLLLQKKRPDTVCGYVRQIGREGQESGILTLADLCSFEADMLTTIFIGNAETITSGGKMVTPRGYRLPAGKG